MLHLHKRGRWFHARGRVRGKLIRESLGTKSQLVAQIRLRALEDDAWSGEVQPRADWPGFYEELVKLFSPPLVKPLTSKKYLFVLQRFSQFLDSAHIFELTRITESVIDEYVAQRMRDRHPTRGREVGREGIKSDLRIIHRMFAVALDRGYVQRNPVRGPFNSQPAETQPFSREEVAAMLRSCQARDRRGAPLDLTPIILLFLNTGLRISDVIGFPKRGLKAGIVSIVTRKRGRPIQIPLHEATRLAIDRWKQAENEKRRRSPYLFSTESGKPIKNLDAYLRRLWARAGITGAHPHRFRDTFAVWLLERGASLYDVAKLLGITEAVAARHYAPYVKELQERGQRLVASLELPAAG